MRGVFCESYEMRPLRLMFHRFNHCISISDMYHREKTSLNWISKHPSSHHSYLAKIVDFKSLI